MPKDGQRGCPGSLTYPPLEGEGRLRLSAAKCEPGWGDLSTRALFEARDCHPTPARIVLRTNANRPSPSRAGLSHMAEGLHKEGIVPSGTLDFEADGLAIGVGSAES